jgi:beta-lactamase superfamily II metal-dependent hydrolase
VSDTGNVILIDCGYDTSSDFSPYKYLYGETKCTGIEELVITNYDEDHIADLPNLRTELSSDQLRKIKAGTGPISDAMKSMLEMIDQYHGPMAAPIDYGAIEKSYFYTSYPTFIDTNNLSLAFFLHYRDVHVAFTGDLEAGGWEELLKKKAFQDELRRTKVFVASHHGRVSGYYPEVFNYCKPYVVIVSDEEPEAKDESQMYAKHAIGIDWKGSNKKVLRTWDVGHIIIEQGATGGWSIKGSK